jgi:hypothetical protein
MIKLYLKEITINGSNEKVIYTDKIKIAENEDPVKINMIKDLFLKMNMDKYSSMIFEEIESY